MFGRVSSGKSSLLNYVLDSDVLPVGVNPITAVPTRIMFGATPKAKISFMDGKTGETEIGRLSEFVSEHHNPGNSKHVTRIVVELPSTRLRDGVIFVDTPGLGSLATAGAAETLAYLPQCDLGVVLVDASSTLTEDLSTVLRLYEAATPVLVLLSKADLLVPEDRDRSVQYIAGQIDEQLGVKAPVHAVSMRENKLLDQWFLDEIQPLHAKHQELAHKSLRRKIGALNESVEAALKVRLELSEKAEKTDKERLRATETQLRKTAGKFEEVNSFCLKGSDTIHDWGDVVIEHAASAVVDQWLNENKEGAVVSEIVRRSLAETVTTGSDQIFEKLQEFSCDLLRALTEAADALEASQPPNPDELQNIVKERPLFDPGPLEIDIRQDFFPQWGGSSQSTALRASSKQVGQPVKEAFQRYGRLIELWVRKTNAELQRRLDSQADTYRAPFERLISAKETGVEEAEAIRLDLDALSRFRSHAPA